MEVTVTAVGLVADRACAVRLGPVLVTLAEPDYASSGGYSADEGHSAVFGRNRAVPRPCRLIIATLPGQPGEVVSTAAAWAAVHRHSLYRGSGRYALVRKPPVFCPTGSNGAHHPPPRALLFFAHRGGGYLIRRSALTAGSCRGEGGQRRSRGARRRRMAGLAPIRLHALGGSALVCAPDASMPDNSFAVGAKRGRYQDLRRRLVDDVGEPPTGNAAHDRQYGFTIRHAVHWQIRHRAPPPARKWKY